MGDAIKDYLNEKEIKKIVKIQKNEEFCKDDCDFLDFENKYCNNYYEFLNFYYPQGICRCKDCKNEF